MSKPKITTNPIPTQDQTSRPHFGPAEMLERLYSLNFLVVDAAEALRGIAMALPLAESHADHATLYAERLSYAVQIIADALGDAHEQIGDNLDGLKDVLPSKASLAQAAA